MSNEKWRLFHTSIEEFALSMQKMMDKDWSGPKIASYYGISATAVMNWQRKFNLRSRRSDLRTKSKLEKLYVEDKLSMNEIANKLGITYQAVDWYLRKFEIQKRSASDIQKIASQRYNRPVSHILDFTLNGGRSRGYMIRYRGMLCQSAAELTYLRHLDSINIPYKFQPFVFNNRRPDVLIDNKHVVEIKSVKLDQEDHDSYIEWGVLMTNTLGYSYEIISIIGTLRSEYDRTRKHLRLSGARPGIVYNWTEQDESIINDNSVPTHIPTRVVSPDRDRSPCFSHSGHNSIAGDHRTGNFVPDRESYHDRDDLLPIPNLR